MKGFIYLTVSILAEVLATAMLKMSDGFTNVWPTVGLIAGYVVSFYYLSLCLRALPLSLSHAIWAGGGTVLTALLGVAVWGETVTNLKFIGFIMIIGGVVILNLANDTKTERATSG